MAVGEVELHDGVLVIERIAVTYTLLLDPDADRAAVDRAFVHHPQRCPIYRSLHPQIAISTALDVAIGATPAA